MADRSWAHIASGETFEALVTTLVFFEDPAAALFGRRGRDGGQDVRSGSGERVFQAKHHQNGSAAKAIADAKAEAAKIETYRTVGHARYEQWKSVTGWRLVTNAAFNPTDRQTWDDEIVPLFTKIGLRADYWEQANLEALLAKHPEVDRSFFHNETRALLTVPEIMGRLPGEEPFLSRGELGSFFGRDRELNEFTNFLKSDKLFLLVHGAGGLGKTRLLLEAGAAVAARGEFQVLWANVASMGSTGGWFEAVVPERPTLLLVDEPEDDNLLQVLAEQLGHRLGRAAKWKVAVAVRSPKDPVLRFLFGARMRRRIDELQLSALDTSSAEAMCTDLLESGPLIARTPAWREMVAKRLAARFARYPVWLTLAIHLLEAHGDLAAVPDTAAGLASMYLDEIVRAQQDEDPDLLRELMRWTSLLRIGRTKALLARRAYTPRQQNAPYAKSTCRVR